MRALIFALGLTLAAASARAQTVIAAADAPKHVGETVTVEGTVSAVHTKSLSGVTFIDMGGRYPNQAFTGVIFKNDTGKFPECGIADRQNRGYHRRRCMTIKESPRPS